VSESALATCLTGYRALPERAQYGLEVLKYWRSGIPTVLVIAITALLAGLDLTDGASRHWATEHAFTTSTVSGLLVLAITILVVNQVVKIRQYRDEAQAIAAQSAILLAQASRAARAVSSAANNAEERDAASEEVRTYLTMLLIAAPVLIEISMPRAFLEQAQQLGAVLASTLAAVPKNPAGEPGSIVRLDDAVAGLRAAAGPLLQILTPAQRAAAGAGDGD
jgi:hypothetical protein